MIPIERLDTERLALCPLDPVDAIEMVAVLADPALYTFTGGTAPSLDDLERRYRAQVAGPVGRDETWCNWIVRTRPHDGIAHGRAIGFVQATIVGVSADIAWLVGVEHQGRGYGTEAARAMGDWLVASGVVRIVAHIHPQHVASQRVAVGIGLSDSGTTDDDGEAIWAFAQPST